MASYLNLQESIEQQVSLIKTNNSANKYTLQIPHFFSEEKKIQKSNIISSNKFVNQAKHVNHKNIRKLSKLTLKSSKTQKEQTPTKVMFNNRQLKIEKQKFKELLSKGRSKQENKMKMQKRYSQFTQIDQIKSKYINQQQKIKQDSQFNNQNIIKYRIGKQKKNNEKDIKIIKFVQTEQAYYQNTEIKTSRESKLITEYTSLNKIQGTTSKVDLINKKLFEDFVNVSEQLKKNIKENQTMLSPFSKPVLKTTIVQKYPIEHLQFVKQVIKKTISQPNNLGFPQIYIVTQKDKYQKIIYSFLQQKQRKDYKNFIIYCRMTFYLCAHFILLSINVKVLLGVLDKLLQTQNSLIKIFGVQNEKNRQKFYSQAKMINKPAQTKQNKQQDNLFIQNKNKNIGRNNQIIKSMIQGILNKKNFPSSQLFRSLMVSSIKIESFQFIALFDKTLKWQILKMPTYPFLPTCETNHQYYLILDLDETLIHFDSQQDLLHIRPYAEVFIKKLSTFFQITIFTAATKEYADDIINEIDKEGHIKHRLYRNHLTFLKGQPLKDISLLGRNLKTTIIIDNLQSNFKLQMDNGIEIKPWLGKGQDNVLEKMEIFLLKIVNQFPEDLRKGLKIYKNYIERQIGQKQNLRPKIIFRM